MLGALSRGLAPQAGPQDHSSWRAQNHSFGQGEFFVVEHDIAAQPQTPSSPSSPACSTRMRCTGKLAGTLALYLLSSACKRRRSMMCVHGCATPPRHQLPFFISLYANVASVLHGATYLAHFVRPRNRCTTLQPRRLTHLRFATPVNIRSSLPSDSYFNACLPRISLCFQEKSS